VVPSLNTGKEFGYTVEISLFTPFLQEDIGIIRFSHDIFVLIFSKSSFRIASAFDTTQSMQLRSAIKPLALELDI